MKIKWIILLTLMFASLTPSLVLSSGDYLPYYLSSGFSDNSCQLPLKYRLQQYLENKGSPLKDYVDVLLAQEHWKLIIAISSIESQFCKKQLHKNCWGIVGKRGYRHYESYTQAIIDANDFIEDWQQKGKLLSLESANGFWNVPATESWIFTTKKTMKEIENL